MATKNDFIKILDEMALLLDLKGANPYKIRAFQNASRTIQSLSVDIEELVRSGKITQIKGIGKGIADVIKEIVETGGLKELEAMKAEIPTGLLEMVKIPGMGPKKIKAVWKKLDITTIGELEYACKENRLRDLEGFGQKTQEKILKGIEFLKRYSNRHLLSRALNEANEFVRVVSQISDVEKCEITGSLRRWLETIQEIELVIQTNNSSKNAIKQQIFKLPQTEKIFEDVDTKITLLLKSGFRAIIWFATPQNYAIILLKSTGTEGHIRALQQHAQNIGLTFSQNYLVKNDSTPIECPDESSIYNAIHLPFIPPELREGKDEVEKAVHSKLPELIKKEDLKGIIHVHTNYSDGAHSLKEMAEACQERGFHYMVVCDHSRSAHYANGLSEERIKQQQTEISELNEHFSNFRILSGIELDILPDGSLDYDDEVLASFDIVIASIHSRLNMTEEEATNRLIRAMENPFVTILGHPTGRLLLAREGYPVNMHQIIEKAAELGVAIELNANPHRLDIDWRFLRLAKEQGVKISINPDAHYIKGLDDVIYGLGIARKGWQEKSDVLNCLSADELIAFARARRGK